MEASVIAALSELADSLRGDEKKTVTREDFAATLKQHLSGSHAEHQITQLWEKMCVGGRTIGKAEVCSFLLGEMQQRESQARAHHTLPLPHQPSFSIMPNTKETVCAVLTLSSPPQYMTVCKDGSVGIWSTRFQLQQSTSVGSGHGSGGGRRGLRSTVWVTSCVMVCGRLVVATTGRELAFYDRASLTCLHRLQKLPSVPLCLAYGSKEEEEETNSSPGHLVWGDENGCVGILSFSQTTKSLFHSTLITFNQVRDHTPQVTLQYEPVHSDWVCQVGWTGPAHCIISVSRSSSHSLVIQHIRAQHKPYIFKVRMGVTCFAHSHKLEVVATGSLDHIVRLWTPFSPHHPVACLSSHAAGVVGVVIVEHPQLLLSLAQDLSLCVWDIREHYLLQIISVKFAFTQRLPDFGSSPLSLLPLPTPSLTVSCNEYIAKFTLTKGAGAEEVQVDTGHTQPVCAVVYCPLLDQLVSGCEGGEVRVWDINSGRCVMKIEGCHGDQELTAMAMDKSRILTGSRHGAIKVWERLTGQCLQSLTTAGGTEVVSIVHNPERWRFLATGWNRDITVYEDKTHGLSPQPAWNEGTPHSDDIITMDYCPPNYLATGSFDGLTVVWNTDTERVVSQFHSMAKQRRPLLLSATAPPSSLSTPSSRPASRRLSSYHLKSASSSHLRHVPVDQVIFLKTRVLSKIRGQSTLVTSEAGYAQFWDMFSSGPPLGGFHLTSLEGEVVLALTIDDNCQRLVAGDTAGYINLFNIEHFCTSSSSQTDHVLPECTWLGHDCEIMSVVWVGAEFLVSASADHSVRMWTTNSHCVGYFGQPQCWTKAIPATFSHSSHPDPTTVSEGLVEDGGERKERGSEEEDQGRGEVERERAESQVDTPSEELSSLNDKCLGVGYQSGIRRRMAERLQRRTHFSEVAITQGPAPFSPYQALHVPDVRDVDVPRDVAMALQSS